MADAYAAGQHANGMGSGLGHGLAHGMLMADACAAGQHANGVGLGNLQPPRNWWAQFPSFFENLKNIAILLSFLTLIRDMGEYSRNIAKKRYKKWFCNVQFLDAWHAEET